MSIYIVTGKPRNGKTFFIIRHIPRWLKYGNRIFSNIKLNLGTGALKKFNENLIGNLYDKNDLNNPEKQIFYWRNIHDWNLMNNGIIIVDEAQKYFNARSWAHLSEDTEAKLQEHGKEDLDVWATTQHFTRIDVTLRILVEEYYKVKMIFGKPENKKGILPKICRAESYLLEDLEKVERLTQNDEPLIPESSELFRIRKKYYEIYDTRAKVGKSLPMPLIHKLRTCETCGLQKIEHN